MTQRSVPTTQSKLTVQAPTVGSGIHPTPESISLRIAASAILSTGDYRARLAILQEGLIRAKTVSSGSVGGSAHPCALSRIWGRSLERKFANLLT